MRAGRWLIRSLLVVAIAAALSACGSAPRPSAPDARGISGRPAPFQSGYRDIRVMTFNLRVAFAPDMGNHWRHRRDLALDTIRAFDPDLICTQEVSLRQADDLFEALRRDYRFIGVGRDDGGLDGEMCAIFMHRQRFAYLGEVHSWLSETPSVPGSRSWGASAPRVVTGAKLRCLTTRRSLYVFNTHFDAWSEEARVQSARLLRELLEAVVPRLPVIVAGDFNAAVGSEPYRTLLATQTTGGTLRDTYRDAHPLASADEGTKHNFRGRIQRDGARIDWVLASPTFETVHAAIDRSNIAGRYPSDHFPVQAVLRWRR